MNHNGLEQESMTNDDLRRRVSVVRLALLEMFISNRKHFIFYMLSTIVKKAIISGFLIGLVSGFVERL